MWNLVLLHKIRARYCSVKNRTKYGRWEASASTQNTIVLQVSFGCSQGVNVSTDSWRVRISTTQILLMSAVQRYACTSEGLSYAVCCNSQWQVARSAESLIEEETERLTYRAASFSLRVLVVFCCAASFIAGRQGRLTYRAASCAAWDRGSLSYGVALLIAAHISVSSFHFINGSRYKTLRSPLARLVVHITVINWAFGVRC